MIEERIRLAEAMGWTRIRMKHVAMDGQSYPFACPPADQYSDGKVDPTYRQQIPDPFTDANDDYAVLEWMRERGIEAWQIVEECEYCIHYKIGDYARAALKVIE